MFLAIYILSAIIALACCGLMLWAQWDDQGCLTLSDICVSVIGIPIIAFVPIINTLATLVFIFGIGHAIMEDANLWNKKFFVKKPKEDE